MKPGFVGSCSALYLMLSLSGCQGKHVRVQVPPIPGTAQMHGLSSGQFTPVVNQRMTPYAGLSFHPGDAITIQAGGCVDVGGGNRYRRYVDAGGADSDRFYHGRIWIPGVTPGLVRIAGWVGRPLSVNLRSDSSADSLFIRLGFEAPDYSKPKIPPAGAELTGECAGMGPAFVTISVQPGAVVAERSPAPPFDLDLRNGFDANFVALHPFWTYWNSDRAAPRPADAATSEKPQQPKPPALPDAAIQCAGFPVNPDGTISFGSPSCTSQAPWTDHPKGLKSDVCHLGGTTGTLRGHVNWGVATYTGTVTFENWAADGDINLAFTPDYAVSPHSIFTEGNAETDGAIELEFASDETMPGFQTEWWERFRRTIERAAPTLDSYAIITGLAGLDNEHYSHAELHPLYALAIQLDADHSHPGKQTWEMFVRNWGDEGFCSQDVHYLDLPNNSYTFSLKWLGGDSLPPVETNFKSLSGRTVQPQISRSKAGDVLVTFNLDVPENMDMIAGELSLQWPEGSTLLAGTQPPQEAPERGGRPQRVGLLAETAARQPAAQAVGEDAINEAFMTLTQQQKQDIAVKMQARVRQLRSQRKPEAQVREQVQEERLKIICKTAKSKVCSEK
jgi:hypothetical protein